MKRTQLASLLVLAFIWLTTCGFVSWGDSTTAGIADIMAPMTSEDFEKVEVLEEWGKLCMPNVK